ncbi:MULTISPECIES: hypothetical protein [unclassified Leucobacter]|uniref:hypothetical protein n=1 Tax=unclassified Leucobacter TaxID=2621730 RepID=UPI0006217F43|nr:hypothetical protein [Leucobacter sp. Ag1]KKI18719.1 hypothetical protein XM48_10580 [Leucobacter sp. Ag1]
MSTSAFQRQADPVAVDWSIGRAPLALRGIRFAEGEGGAPPAAPAAPSDPAAAAAPNPAQLAAFYAAQHGSLPPNPSPAAAAPVAPAAPAPIQGFTPEQVQKLMTEGQSFQKAAEEAQTALAVAQKERDEAQAQIAQFAREKAVTAAAAEKANPALLLDSASFQAAIKDIDLTDAEKLGAAITEFVTANPAYAATPAVAAPTLPGSSGPAPSGGTTPKPTTLAGALAAALGD